MGSTGLSSVLERIADAAGRADRDDPIELVVVTKYASDAAVSAVLSEGATSLGESRARQLEERSQRFAARWHFIGRLQRNKVARVKAAAALMHSMDRDALCDAWQSDSGPPPVLVQVNLADEPQKGGVAPSDARALVDRCIRSGIEVRGLMTVPPVPERPEDSARWFSQLRLLRDAIAKDHPSVAGLSMGMSDDYEVAVGEGATILRVGRAIFEPFDDKG